jgi:acid phosphatase family membrane protein YuiD
MNDYDIQKFAIGIGLIFLTVKILKRYLKIPRPVMLKDSTFGMPSTRAAIIFFIITFIILTNNVSLLTILMLLVVALVACGLKYILKEHSFNQLFAGTLLGIMGAWLIQKV